MNTTTEHRKSKHHEWGQTVPLMVVLGAIATWCVGLSLAAFNTNGAVAALTATVNDIKESTSGFPQVKAEVDWLAQQKGYNEAIGKASSSTAENR